MIILNKISAPAEGALFFCHNPASFSFYILDKNIVRIILILISFLFEFYEQLINSGRIESDKSSRNQASFIVVSIIQEVLPWLVWNDLHSVRAGC